MYVLYNIVYKQNDLQVNVLDLYNWMSNWISDWTIIFQFN